MSKRKQKRSSKPIQRSPEVAPVVTVPKTPSYPEKTRIWRRLPGSVWAAILAGITFVGLYAAYPSLSINEDYTFDAHNPYNTSFSVINEGYVTANDVTSVCTSTFEFIPPPDAKVLLGPLTTRTPPTLFAEKLAFKDRASIPCNHNVAANGHPLMPGATLNMVVSYKFLGFKVTRNSNFYAVLWWDNTYRWEYGTLHEHPGSTISLSANDVRERN